MQGYFWVEVRVANCIECLLLFVAAARSGVCQHEHLQQMAVRPFLLKLVSLPVHNELTTASGRGCQLVE